jgi:RNA polymerase sigma-70 factor (TIGR02960 family)
VTDDFAALTEPHRRELHIHCYRMLGSFDDAEDLVQETLLRAWRGRDSLRDEAGRRAWLYKIATNACLDAIKARKRRVAQLGSFAEVPWLQPYPDQLLDEVAPSEEQPDAVVVGRETIELTYVAVLQLLPPRQRSALILRDVLEWSAAETADALQMSVAAANSALQRARATLEERLGERGTRSDLSEPDQELLERLIDAHERADVEAAVALMREDVRVTMPPNPWLYDGLAAVRPLLETGLPEPGEWRLVATRANRMPAFASYLKARGEDEFKAFKLDVVRLRGGLIAEITTFGTDLFDAFGLPAILDR